MTGALPSVPTSTLDFAKRFLDDGDRVADALRAVGIAVVAARD